MRSILSKVYAKQVCQSDSKRSFNMTLLLYWFPFSGSLAPMAVLEEVGAFYEKNLIDMNKGEHQSPEYLKIHPLGLVPALRLGNGETIFESAGICMYLSDLYLKYGLSPPIDDPARGAYNKTKRMYFQVLWSLVGPYYAMRRYDEAKLMIRAI